MNDQLSKVFYLGSLYPDSAPEISKLRKNLWAYDHLQVMLCNGYGSWRGYDVREYNYDNPASCKLGLAEAKLEEKILSLLKDIDHGIVVKFGGDPRGYCVSMKKKMENGYEQELSHFFYY